jgi:hypothetical protein
MTKNIRFYERPALVNTIENGQATIEPVADPDIGVKAHAYKTHTGEEHLNLVKNEFAPILTADLKTGGSNPAAKLGRTFWNNTAGCMAVWVDETPGTERYINLSGEASDMLVRRCDNTVVKKDLQSILDASGGSMILSGMDLTENADGTIDLSAAEFATRQTATSQGTVMVCSVDAIASLALADESKNYVYIDYGGGTYAYGVTQDLNALLYDYTKQTGWIVTRTAGTVLDVVDIRLSNVNFSMRWNARQAAIKGYEQGPGAALSVDVSHYVTVTAGAFYLLTNLIQTPAFDTAPAGGGDLLHMRYRDGGGAWTRVTSDAVDYAKHDDGTGTLATAGSSKYTVHFIHMIFNNPSKIGLQYGQNVYNSEADALDSPLPLVFPPEFDPGGTSTPIYKIVTKADGSTSTVVPIQAVPVEGVTGVEHNQLPGLQGGIGNEYYHLTAQQNQAVQDLISATEITREASGFDVPEDVIETYDITARTVTLTGIVNAIEKNAPIAALVSGWVSTAHPTAPTQTQFLYYDNGSFFWSTTPWEFWQVPIAAVVFNSVGDYLWTLRECHGTMPWQNHRADHKNRGTYRDTGGILGGYTLDSTTPGDRRPSISECLVYDEDLPSTLGVLGSGATFTRLYYNAGGVPKKLLNQADIVQLNGTTPQFNDPVAGGYTDMTNNYHMSVWVIAIPVAVDDNGTEERFVFLNGQSQSALESTQLAQNPKNLKLGELTLISPEFTFISQVVIKFIAGDWTITQVRELTGNRASFVSAPGGETTVVTDGITITGNGTVADPIRLV